jgi:hypothetical protein
MSRRGGGGGVYIALVGYCQVQKWVGAKAEKLPKIEN